MAPFTEQCTAPAPPRISQGCLEGALAGNPAWFGWYLYWHHLLYLADILRLSKVISQRNVNKRRARLLLDLMVCGEKSRSDEQEALGWGSPLKKSAGEHRELPGYASPHLYDGYEVFVTFLLKHHSM